MRDHKTLPAGAKRESVSTEIEDFLFAYSPDLIVVSEAHTRVKASRVSQDKSRNRLFIVTW